MIENTQNVKMEDMLGFEGFCTMAYKLELSASSRVHLVFYFSCLNKVTGDKLQVQSILSELDKEVKIILEPKAVMESGTCQLQNLSISEYLIKWKNLPLIIPHERMIILYRSIHNYSSIEDHYFFEGEGHVSSLYY